MIAQKINLLNSIKHGHDDSKIILWSDWEHAWFEKPEILTPHVKVRDISFLNFEKMKEMGMQKIIFDKDAVLTTPYETNFFEEDVKKAFIKAKGVFGKENILVLSNMTFDRYSDEFSTYDNELRKVNFLHTGKNDDIWWKPYEFKAAKKIAMEKFNYDMSETEKIVMIGSHLTNDILFGNINKMVTVWVNRFRSEFDKAEMSVMRSTKVPWDLNPK